MGKKICFVDIDSTLFQTDLLFHVDLRNEFSGVGLDMQLWDAGYQRVRGCSYSLTKHLREVQKLMGDAFPSAAVGKLIAERFSNLNRYLFADVEPFLALLQSREFCLAVLSFGSPEWQRFKLDAAGVGDCFDHFFFTSQPNTKMGIVQNYWGSCDRILVIDNHPSELDAIKEAMPDVQTILINRVPSAEVLAALPANSYLEAQKYAAMVPRCQHLAVTTLDDIILT